MSEQGKCDHTKVVLRRNYTNDSYADSWHCDDCEVEFYHLENIRMSPLTIVEPCATLRDEFAMAAMQGLFSASYDGFWVDTASEHNTAAQAYRWADTMLEARKQ